MNSGRQKRRFVAVFCPYVGLTDHLEALDAVLAIMSASVVWPSAAWIEMLQLILIYAGKWFSSSIPLLNINPTATSVYNNPPKPIPVMILNVRMSTVHISANAAVTSLFSLIIVPRRVANYVVDWLLILGGQECFAMSVVPSSGLY